MDRHEEGFLMLNAFPLVLRLYASFFFVRVYWFRFQTYPDGRQWRYELFPVVSKEDFLLKKITPFTFILTGTEKSGGLSCLSRFSRPDASCRTCPGAVRSRMAFA
jgi:hypothetical protein